MTYEVLTAFFLEVGVSRRTAVRPQARAAMGACAVGGVRRARARCCRRSGFSRSIAGCRRRAATRSAGRPLRSGQFLRRHLHAVVSLPARPHGQRLPRDGRVRDSRRRRDVCAATARARRKPRDAEDVADLPRHHGADADGDRRHARPEHAQASARSRSPRWRACGRPARACRPTSSRFPTRKPRRNRFEISIPVLGSIYLTHDPNGTRARPQGLPARGPAGRADGVLRVPHHGRHRVADVRRWCCRASCCCARTGSRQVDAGCARACAACRSGSSPCWPAGPPPKPAASRGPSTASCAPRDSVTPSLTTGDVGLSSRSTCSATS